MSSPKLTAPRKCPKCGGAGFDGGDMSSDVGDVLAFTVNQQKIPPDEITPLTLDEAAAIALNDLYERLEVYERNARKSREAISLLNRSYPDAEGAMWKMIAEQS